MDLCDNFNSIQKILKKSNILKYVSGSKITSTNYLIQTF